MPSPAQDVTKSIHHAHSKSINLNSVVLLATAQVRVVNQSGDLCPARILLDQGSEVSLITERLAQQLRITRTSSQIRLIGIGTQCTEKARGMIRLILQPHFNSSTEIPVTAHILPKLTSILPAEPISHPSWPYLQNLQLADPHFAQPGSIDMILGADTYGLILEGSVVKRPPDSPIAQSTKLGWIVSGPTNVASTNQTPYNCHCAIEPNLSELLEKFWQQEEIPSSNKQSLSTLDQSCEDHFVRTHSRNSNGRYIVRLPFKTPPEQLGESLPVARRMLIILHGKLKRTLGIFKHMNLS